MVEKHTDPDSQRSQASQMGEALGVGLQFALAVLLFLFVGKWLDARLHTAPWLLLTGVFVGAVGGFTSIYRHLVVAPRERERRRKEREEEGRS